MDFCSTEEDELRVRKKKEEEEEEEEGDADDELRRRGDLMRTMKEMRWWGRRGMRREGRPG